MSLLSPPRRPLLMPAWSRNDLWRRAAAVPSLDLNFAAAKALGPLVTFTRASTATFIDSAGVLQTAATDVPRFDHNPTTGESLGLLVEESRTNSIRNNTMVGAVAGTPGTLPTNWVGTTTLQGLSREIVATGSSNGITYIRIKVSGTTTNTNTFFNVSTFDAPSASAGQSWATSTYCRLHSGSISTGILRVEFARFNPTYAGSSTFNIVPTSANLNEQRFSTMFTPNDVGLTAINFGVQFFVAASGVAVDFTIDVGLPQLEEGAFATSVIPTTTAAATRSADVASITGTNFSSWYRQDEGTVLADATIANTGSNRFIAGASDATANEEIALYWNTVFNSLVNDGAVSQANSFGGTVAAGSRALHSFAYKANDFQGYGNAVALSADTSGTLPTADRLTIGSRVNSTFWTNGTIRRLTYWPQRLANSTLQAITL